MSRQKYYQLTGLVLVMLMVASCKVSPLKMFNEWRQHKFSAKKKSVISDDAKTNGEKPDEVGNEEGGTATDGVTDGSITANTAPALCARLLKTFKNEPRFYHFQASLKAYERTAEQGELVRSHMVYHGIFKPQKMQADIKVFKDCAAIVMAFNRFPEIIAVNRMPADAKLARLTAILDNFKAGRQIFPALACAEVVSHLAEAKTYKNMLVQIQTHRRAGTAEKFVFDALTTAQKNTQEEAKETISAKGCLIAIQMLELGGVQRFAKAPLEEQSEILRKFTSY